MNQQKINKFGLNYMTATNFFITERNKKLSLWVKTQNTDACNIWDLMPSELTSDVKKAIIHAFFLGASMQETEIQKNKISWKLFENWNAEFTDKRKA